ncbi:hypothetical protein L9F63_024665, partial [Diploptera punctata]
MLEEVFEDDLIGDPNDLEEIIEQQAEEIEDDPEAQGGEANNAAENDTANADGTRIDPKKKRIVRNPQPKLNPERLKGPRGIAILEENFKDFKFHGKGYERVDLNRVMKRLEHWAHRLFPRFQFDDCLEKIEKLGQKKPVQVYIKKIRMGLETGEEQVILHDDDEDEQNDQLQNAHDTPIDVFDQLLEQQLSQVQTSQTSVPTTPTTSLQDRPPLPPSSQNQNVVQLTDEQKERILRNRLLAEERKLARMKAKREIELAAQEPSTSFSVTTNTSPATQIDPAITNTEYDQCIPNLVHDEDNYVDTVKASETNSTAESNSCNLANGNNELISVPDFRVQNNSVPMSVDGEQNSSPSTLLNEEQNSNSKSVIDNQQTEKDHHNIVCTPFDDDQNNSNAMLVDNEQLTIMNQLKSIHA